MVRVIITSLVVTGLGVLASTFIEDSLIARTAILTILILALWLTELIPLYATSLVLLIGIPLLLAPIHREFAFSKVILWPANPVLALFFGGFVLSVAGRKYGIDGYIARFLLSMSKGNQTRLMLTVLFGTAILSMWMSNIAACAMMVMVLRPLWKHKEIGNSFRTTLLLSLAFGANFGGMATPIGTGPNAIAIAAIQQQHSLTFIQWMLIALPLTAGMLLLTFLILKLKYPTGGQIELPAIPLNPVTPKFRAVVTIFFAAVLAWLLEPLHGVPSAIIAMGVAVLLFGSGLLTKSDLGEIDWGTLLLIAGGLTLGELLDRTGLVKAIASSIQWNSIPRFVMLFGLLFSTAFLSAIASNTAASVLFIQLAASIDPSVYLPMLIAMAASLGAPFVISTPPNTMVYGEGGIRSSDFFLPGLLLMIIGCLVVAWTGPDFLAMAGLLD